MNKQFIDLGFNHKELEEKLVSIGLWNTPEKRKRHGYVLSPCGYLVSRRQQEELDSLAKSTYKALQVLEEVLCKIGRNTPRTQEEREIYSIANRSKCGLAVPGEFAPSIPPILKVDLVQTPEGHFKIAEVDAYNPRGLAFMALLDATLPEGAPSYPGIFRLAQMLGTDSITYLFSEKERYYEPVFKIWANLMKEAGIEMKIIRESELASGQELPGDRLFVIPDSLNYNIRLREDIIQRIRDGEIQVFFPPKAYLGSKGFMPFLRELPDMHRFIPNTQLVSKKHRDELHLNPGKEYVLKRLVSSGLKGVLFSDLDPAEFSAELERQKKAKRASWILQEQVPQEPLSLKVFDDEGNVVVKDYYLRITAQTTADGILGLDITGRTDRKVHGAPDCIQIPAVLE